DAGKTLGKDFPDGFAQFRAGGNRRNELAFFLSGIDDFFPISLGWRACFSGKSRCPCQRHNKQAQTKTDVECCHSCLPGSKCGVRFSRCFPPVQSEPVGYGCQETCLIYREKERVLMMRKTAVPSFRSSRLAADAVTRARNSSPARTVRIASPSSRSILRILTGKLFPEECL